MIVKEMIMKSINMIIKLALVLLLNLSIASFAHAENKALERAQYMLRQLNSQKVQLEKQNTGLKAELAALKKDSEKKLKQQKAGNKKLGAAAKNKDKKIENLRQKLKDTIIALRKSEQERLQANSTGKVLDAEIKQCVSNNQKLVHMNDKLIDNYNKKGCWDSIAQNEPFTGFNQVAIENVLQEYRFANEDYKVRESTEFEQSGGSISVAPEDDLGS